MRRLVEHAIVCALVILCLSGATAGVALGVGTPQPQDPVGAAQTDRPARAASIDGVFHRPLAGLGPETVGLFAVQNRTDGENATKRHENPENLNEDGDLGQVESWLLGELSGRLSDGALQLSEGQYEFARQFLDESFRERVGQYVDVAGETEESSDEEAEETAKTLQETRDTQEQLTDTAEAYEETRVSYEDAQEQNDTERARKLARELDDRAAEIERQIARLRQLYDQLEAVSGEDFAEAIAALNDLEAEIQAEVSEIQLAEFVETELTVEVAAERISFLDPLSATGQLSTAGGKPVANESIRLTIANESRQVETDTNGAFEFSYRPVVLPLTTSALSVQYVPADQSVYLGSAASVPVTVEQVQPRIDNLSNPAELAFAERVPVSGDVAVEDVPVDGVSVEILLAGQRLGTMQVTNGSFDTTVTVPASVPDGDRDFVARIPDEDRAIAGVSDSRVVTVRETATTLSVNATQVADSEMTVTGTLATVDDVGVGGEPVQVSIDGQTVATVTTTDNGAFTERVSVSVPSTGEEYVVGVSYEQPATNLGPSEAETVIEMEPGGGTGEGGSGTGGDGGETGGDGGETGGDDESRFPESIVDSETPVWVWLGAGLGVAVAILVLWLVGRRLSIVLPSSDVGFVTVLRGGPPWATTAPETDSDETQSNSGMTIDEAVQEAPDSPVAFLLGHASEQLQAGQPDAAIQSCYAAVRHDITSRSDAARALTHWEFYREFRETAEAESAESGSSVEAVSAGEASSTDALREVTEEYEHAAFSPEEVPPDSARRAIDRASRLCHVDSPVPGDPFPGDD